MPETPDFESIARRLIVLVDPNGAEEDENPVDDLHRQAIANQLAAVVEQVRLVWNARGAADIAKLQTELSMLMGSTMAGPYVSNLDRALRTLDR